MALNQDDVAKVAHLARLAIDSSNTQAYADDLTSILALVDQMQAVDTQQVEPMSHPLDATQRLRPDEVTETDQRNLLQQGAPAVEQGLFLVPKVIE